MRIFLVALLALAVGCKAKAAKPAGFVKHERMTKEKDLPFHFSWRNPNGDFARYSKVYVAPVDTAHMLKMDWYKRGEAGAAGDFSRDLAQIAIKAREMMVEAFKKPAKGVANRFTVVDKPTGADTLILELAIVEIVPSKASLEAASWAMPTGTGVLLSPLNTSTAAMEGRYKDGKTGTELLTFADREGEKARPIDLAGFTWYTHAKGIMKDWANQLVQVANQKPGETVKDSKVFTLKPW